MWSDDEELVRRANALPASVQRAHTASRRPRAAQWFMAGSALAGGITAVFATIALTAGICLDGAQSCSLFGQSTAMFCLFTVPLGIAIGLMVSSRQIDRAITAYRPIL